MTNAGYSGKSFQTAAHRRAGTRIRFEVQAWVYDDADNPDDEGYPVVVELVVDPRLDIIRLGAAFGGLGTLLQGMGKTEVSDDEKVAVIARETPRARDKLRDCLVPPSRLKFDEVKDTLDIQAIGSIVQYITGELSGMDPTQRPSSSTGSAPASPSSTAGAQPEE